MVSIRCKNCNYTEEANKTLFLKLLGISFVGGGYWAWVAYFFAGTGFAFVICVSIVTGGVAMLAFSDTITKWIAERYNCPKCNKNNWEMIK